VCQNPTKNTHKKHHHLLFPLLALVLFTCTFLPSANARSTAFPPARPLYLTCSNNAYIIFPTSINSFTVSTFYRDSLHRWHIGDYWITTTKTITITSWFEDNWLEYTCTGTGVQQIYNGSKPHLVYINGINKTEGSGWTYSTYNQVIEITTATTSASLYFGTGTPPPPPPPSPYTSLVTLLIPEDQSVGVSYLANTMIITPTNYTLIGLNFTLNTLLEGGGEIAFYNYNPINFTITGTYTNLIVTRNNIQISAPGGKVQSAMGDTLIIAWSWPIALIPFAGDLVTFMGIGGLVGFFLTPVYVSIQIKRKKAWEGILTGIIIGSVCFGLMLGWLLM